MISGPVDSIGMFERMNRGIPSGVNPQQNYGDVFAGMSAYEVDVWGKIRRANEAARARYLATQDAQRIVRQTLVAQVATAYLSLLALDYDLEIARRTLEARTNSLVLTVAREQGGVAAMQDVAQAKILVYGAEASIVDIQRQREQQENALCILLGRNPGSIQRGAGFVSQQVRAEVRQTISIRRRQPDTGNDDAFVIGGLRLHQAVAVQKPTSPQGESRRTNSGAVFSQHAWMIAVTMQSKRSWMWFMPSPMIQA